MYVKGLSKKELEDLKRKVDKEYEERTCIETNKLSSIKDILEEMEKYEEVENAYLNYYTDINPQFANEYKTTSHWSASYAELSDEGLEDLRNNYLKNDVFKYGKHIYVFIDEGSNRETTGGMFQGLIKAYYRKFRIKKVKIE